jgi:hypothetical protein
MPFSSTRHIRFARYPDFATRTLPISLGACSGGKFIVSRARGAYDARTKGSIRKVALAFDMGSSIYLHQKGAPSIKSLRLAFPICTIGLLVLAATAVAQDADKQKLIEIENAFAANQDPGPQAAAVAKKYVYDGATTTLTTLGRVGTLPKARIIELSSAPDPSDPNVKTSQKLSDFHVEIYGSTALVSYKQTSSDTGHKDPALNVTVHLGCLDTFVNAKGAWYWIGGGCASDAPIPQSVWDASKKAIAQEPKDLQQAYH